MKIEQELNTFEESLSMKIDNILSPEICKELILKYEEFAKESPVHDISERITNECRDMVFINELDSFLQEYFKGDYQIFWSTFDMIDTITAKTYISRLWHLDGGIPRSLKLFIYLTPVSDHGGNTIIIDRERTQKLRDAGALPIEAKDRVEDITPVLEQLELDTDHLEYDLKTGDGLLFSPFLLAHKCLPPKEEGKKRYTISFTLVKI